MSSSGNEGDTGCSRATPVTTAGLLADLSYIIISLLSYVAFAAEITTFTVLDSVYIPPSI